MPLLSKLLGSSFIILAIIFLIWFKITNLQEENIKLTNKVTELTTSLNTITRDSELARKSYEERLAKLPTEIEVIKTQYKPRYLYIQTWKGDSNVSECNNTLSFLHSINY
jgi:hypothetical protein